MYISVVPHVCIPAVRTICGAPCVRRRARERILESRCEDRARQGARCSVRVR
jgi:hypothetical protein